MAKYIECEALLDGLRESRKALQEICKSLKFPVEKQICDAQILTFQECILRVKEQPTADVVEVVHCRDCKHLYQFSAIDRQFYCRHYPQGLTGINIVEDNPYCSYGERKCDNG